MRKEAVKLALLALLIPFLIVSSVVAYFYVRFSLMIESKLGEGIRRQPSEIYAAPYRILPGTKVSRSDLVERLKRIGYRENRSGGRAPLWFREVNSSTIEIHDELTPGQPQTVRIVLRNNYVSRIVGVKGSSGESGYALRPEMVTTIFNRSREKRKYVTFDQLPRHLVNAILAAEDKRFFKHSGLDLIRIVKAAFVDIRAGDVVQGASTITQQFAKNFFLTPERTWRRKLAEAFIAILLEQRFSKEKIFELYANEVYLGQRGSFSIIGVGEAADAYFHKNVSDLTLPEAALLAGLIQAPNRYSPYKYPERAKERRNAVLEAMAENGFIAPQESAAAQSAPLGVKPIVLLNWSDAPYFVDLVRDQLLQEFSEEALTSQAYRIYTSLDLDLQAAAYEAVREGLRQLDEIFRKRRRSDSAKVQAALIALDPSSGEIVALVGGRNYAESQYNRATEARRQPGSIFKPFVYAAALNTAYSEASPPITTISTVVDEPTIFYFDNAEYEPKNYMDEYYGEITLREALERSLNVATVKFAEMVGFERVAELAKKAGLGDVKPYPSIALGTFEATPLEMARAYTIFCNQGTMVEPVAIREITTPDGKVIRSSQRRARQVLTPQVAYLITNLLEGVIDRGTGAGTRSRGFLLPAAGKTGTSHDGWFAGYTPELLCVVWVGFDDNRELQLSGAQSALPIWTEFMKRAALIRRFKGEGFPVPDGIAFVEIDADTRLVAAPGCYNRRLECFVAGTEVTEVCDLHASSLSKQRLAREAVARIFKLMQRFRPISPAEVIG